MNQEVTIFSIPNTSRPSELKSQGFTLIRNLTILGQVDSTHSGEIEFCQLDLGYARINISYRDNDTTKIKVYAINIDRKPFEQMTGLKAQAYKSVEINGFNYNVKTSENNMSLYLTRLGL